MGGLTGEIYRLGEIFLDLYILFVDIIQIHIIR